MANRLASATSPYLLQHAKNPVDWWEWGPEAFAEAKRRDAPILLSVGYAACHWCHVMAHESFENEATAALINRGFLPVKVDREERPDVDTVYMQATQAMTGQGGWPMTVFLTPDRRPFYAGTYFPPTPRHGLPSFAQVLGAIEEAWRDRREEVVQSAGEITEQLAEMRTGSLAGEVSEADLDEALAALAREYDTERGGFGRAPKFPPSMLLEALLRLPREDAATMASGTLEAMARGGIYDQLGGGFARYSVDAGWVVPHFEKMLYDNALLLGVYTHAWRRTGAERARAVVEGTVEWLLAAMRTPEGGFAASLDADSLDLGGVLREGAYYVWTPAQLAEVLGPDDAAFAAAAYGVTPAGTFEHGASTLRLVGEPDPARLADVRARLLAARGRRTPPGRDDKVVAAWNGWLVEALARSGMVLERPAWVTAATDAAELVWRLHWDGSRLRRTSRSGRVGDAPGILEDYAATAQAAVTLAGVHGDPMWLDRARSLFAVIDDQFSDEEGGYHDTAADAESLVTRPADPTDNATPSGLSATVHALRAMAELSGEDSYAGRADRAVAATGRLVRAAPRFAGWLLADAATRLRSPAVQVALVGEPGPERQALVSAAWRSAPAGSAIVAGEADRPGLALLADRTPIQGRPTAYVCRHFVCRLPVTTVEDLHNQLAGP
ncbi:MAG TPA: thioredoxin domain-containing protein [Microlunatus sp.]|nr:thioredoxin domain-containing protein [Microlunatus sp.]